MFTGIVEELGTIEAVEQQGDAVRLSVRADLVLVDVHLGDSISVNGCCLTVVSTSSTDGDRSTDGDSPTVWTADVMQETLDKTSLLGAGPGDRVNLERAVTAGTRLGGHIVQGHVDGVGTIRRRQPSEHWELVEIDLPPSLAHYLVDKGSVTVDGVSLTVVSTSLDRRTGVASFTVSLIPETLRRTTLGFRQPGDRVNLEVDVIAKYVERMLAPHLTTTPDHSLPPKDAQ
jgi:riboflavin synthase